MYMKEGNLIVPWKPVDEKQLKKDGKGDAEIAKLTVDPVLEAS